MMLPCLFLGDGNLCKVVQSFGYLLYLGWVYTIGNAMHNRLPNQLKPTIRHFNVCCLILLVLILSPYVLYLFLVSYVETYYILILVMCGVSSLIYTISFSARMLESMIEGELVGFDASVKAFLMILMYPFGIWNIQPAVQRVLNKYPISD